MKKIRPILLLTCILMAFSGCEKIDSENGEVTEQPGGQIPGEGDTGEGGNPDGGEEGGEASGGLPVAGYPAGAFTVSSLNNEGISYMWAPTPRDLLRRCSKTCCPSRCRKGMPRRTKWGFPLRAAVLCCPAARADGGATHDLSKCCA